MKPNKKNNHHLYYCSKVWLDLNSDSITVINQALKGCIRFLFIFCNFDHPGEYRQRLVILGLWFVHIRYCIFLYKKIHGSQPPYLSSFFIAYSPMYPNEYRKYDMHFQILSASLYVRGVLMWNSFPQRINILKSRAKFKQAILNNMTQ